MTVCLVTGISPDSLNVLMEVKCSVFRRMLMELQ